MKHILCSFAALLLVAVLGISSVQARNNKIIVDVKDVSLSEVLKSISAQSDYRFVYNNRVIDVNQKISVSISDRDINMVLNKVLYGTGITYMIMDGQIALTPQQKAQEQSGKPKERVIRGKVTDSSGEILPGADVFVDGTTNGAVTDMDGNFTIIVPDDPSTVLVFNFIGMRQEKEEVGDDEVMNIVLTTDTQYLKEVVVTGYQTISRERSAGAFAKVEGAQVQDRGNTHGDILRALEGSVAGLNVNTTAEGTSFLIRGVTSINSSTEPLYIVDGVPMSRSQVGRLVNPNDVAGVSFLKDATAASIWGAQAANGVMVITTKTGSANGRLSIVYNGTFTFKGKPDYSYQDVMTSSQFIDAAVQAFDPDTYEWEDINKTTFGTMSNYPVVYPHEKALYRYYRGEISLAERDAILNFLRSVDGRKEYEKYFMSNSFLTNHSVSLSGGNDRNSYYASLEYQGGQGISQDRSDEYKIYMRDVLNLTKWMKLDLSLNAFYERSRSHLTSGDEYGGDHLTSMPYAGYFDKDGSPLSFTGYIMNENLQQKVESVTGFSLDYNPVADWLRSTQVSDLYSMRANAGLTIDIIDGLSYEGRFQYMTDNAKTERYYPAETFKIRLDRAFATNTDGLQHLPSSGGEFTAGNSHSTSYTVRNQLNFDREFVGKLNHQVTAVAGFEINSNKTASNSTFMRGYDMQTMQYIFYDDYFLYQTGVRNPVLPMIAAATSNQFDPNSYEQSEIEYRFVSAYANAAYTLMDRYSVNASVRVDQSNLFGSDPSVQFKPIWSVGAIWNMAKEDFMAEVEDVDNLNIRLSYGFAGNSPKPGEGGPYDILSSISDPRYNEFGLGYVVTTPANDKLTWEKTRTWNLGIDFGFWNHRFGGSLDMYDKLTTNLLAATPIDPTTGFISVLSNIGTMSNRGVELSLYSTNISRRNFNWNTDFNITYNANRLVSMYITPPDTPSSMVNYEYWEGYPYGTVFGYRWAGLDPSDGMPRVYDSKGNIVRSISDIDNLDAVPYMGTTIPPIFGSLNNSLRYKGFELSFMFVFNCGHVMRNDINTFFTRRFEEELHNDFSLRWRRPGDEKKTDVPAYYKLNDTSVNENDVHMLYKYADINVLNASYIKLRDLSLTYHLPVNVCKAIKARNASVMIQASDLLLIPFNREGIDPEAFYLSGGSRGDRFHPYFTAGLNIEF